MTSEVTSARYSQLIKTAIFLRREHLGRSANMVFETTGAGRTIYVFDSDVVITRCAPWITGPKTEDEDGEAAKNAKEARGQNGYGEIFEPPLEAFSPAPDGDERGLLRRRHAENVALSLADFVFGLATRPGHVGVFQLPSHSAETNNVYRAVRRAYEHFERTDHRRYNARRTFELARMIVLLKQRVSEGYTMEKSFPLIDRLLQVFLYGSAENDSRRAQVIREWDNFYELETQLGGLYSIADAAPFFKDDARVARAFGVTKESDRTLEETETHRQLLSYWRERLSGHKRENVDTDAQALTDLFMINTRLKTTNTRCVFVTGDRTLVKQAYGRIPLRLVPPHDVELANSFSLNFVHHLWGFLSDALIDPANEDLYSGLLARWSDPSFMSPYQLEALITEADKDELALTPESEGNVEEILQQWDQLTQKSVRQYGVKRFNANNALREAIWDRIRKAESLDWSALVPVLKEDVDRVRDRTVLAMSDLGIDSIIKASKLGKRNPPELIFDSLGNTNQIFRRLSSVPGYESVDQFEKDFAKIKDDCYDSSKDGDDRQESHLKFLVLAAAFASADKWMIALSHAKRAISIIERSTQPIPVRHTGEYGGPKSYMSGREAYFLAATAQRLLSTGELDLFQSAKYLNRAREALQRDRSKATAKGITSSRFQNEDVALLLSRYYMARRANPLDLQAPLVEALFRATEPLLEDFAAWGSPRSALVSDVTAVSIATNLIQTRVIQEFRQSRLEAEDISCPVGLDHVRKAVSWIEELSTWRRDQQGAVIATRLISTYAWIGRILALNLSPGEVEEALGALRALLKDASVGYVTVYDAWRYQALKDFVENWNIQREL